MNSMVKTILWTAAPYLAGVIKDAINPEGVILMRDEAIDLLRDLADKTGTELDDTAVEFLIEHAFTLGNIGEYGLRLVSLAKGYIVMSETEWDDRFGLPILKAAEDVLAIMAEDEYQAEIEDDPVA